MLMFIRPQVLPIYSQFFPVFAMVRLKVFCTRKSDSYLHPHTLRLIHLAHIQWYNSRNRAPFRTCQVCTNTPATTSSKNVAKKNAEIFSRAPAASSVRRSIEILVALHRSFIRNTHFHLITPILFGFASHDCVWNGRNSQFALCIRWIRAGKSEETRARTKQRFILHRRSSDLFMLVLKLEGTIVSPENLRFSRQTHTHTFWMSFFFALYS